MAPSQLPQQQVLHHPNSVNGAQNARQPAGQAGFQQPAVDQAYTQPTQVCHFKEVQTGGAPHFIAPVRRAVIGAFAANPRAASKRLNRNIAYRNGVPTNQKSYKEVCFQQIGNSHGVGENHNTVSYANHHRPSVHLYNHSRYGSPANSGSGSSFNLNIQVGGGRTY